MKTLHCKEFGPVENLVWEEAESPEPGEHEVVVSIKAAALNFPDFLIVQGLYQFKPELLIKKQKFQFQIYQITTPTDEKPAIGGNLLSVEE